ncbi:hypothetical protein NDU88_005758 [Pleurodeles waltl]|uniref:Uncharacterized protein n=1 Tax=Pleurodeles waltl TaxID=8319 RepID=A0AAV7SMS9_PLEWA|nr:hypothetical protein NDU88_005758 [Pleurodeles waltl]
MLKATCPVHCPSTSGISLVPPGPQSCPWSRGTPIPSEASAVRVGATAAPRACSGSRVDAVYSWSSPRSVPGRLIRLHSVPGGGTAPALRLGTGSYPQEADRAACKATKTRTGLQSPRGLLMAADAMPTRGGRTIGHPGVDEAVFHQACSVAPSGPLTSFSVSAIRSGGSAALVRGAAAPGRHAPAATPGLNSYGCVSPAAARLVGSPGSQVVGGSR